MILLTGDSMKEAFNEVDPERSMYFEDKKHLVDYVSVKASKGDVILVKGSQSIRTERIVEALLANPADVSKLVRQEKKWKETKNFDISGNHLPY